MMLGRYTSHRRNTPMFQASWFDLLFVVLFVATGLVYLRSPMRWAPNVYLGNDQWGDADFWWQGALQLARGMLWDNVAITFRMGYAIFAGLSVAVLGPHYPLFHHVLVLVFLAVASSVYLTLKDFVGRPVAIALAAVLVSAPAQAEYVAISTSDGLGLMLNIVGLVALILASRSPRRMRFVVLAGMFLSLAGLTRPFMSLFIAPAALVLWATTTGSFVRRSVSVAVLAISFATPTLCWMSVLYAKTGVFALAGYDSSIFYAASSEKIQVWTPDMYPAVQQAAEKRFGGTPTLKQLDEEFWSETLRNYAAEWRYHIGRLGPNILRFAGFDHLRIDAADRVSIWAKSAVRLTLGLCLVGLTLASRRWFAAALLAAVTALSIWPAAVPWLVVAIAAWFLLAMRGTAAKTVNRIVALYWATGAISVFLIGGVSRAMPSGPFQVNALGDRLGTQCFFTDDWLILLGMGAIAMSGLVGAPVEPLRFLAARPLPRALLASAGLAFVAALTLFLSTGAVIAGWRGYRLATAARVPFPSIAPVLDELCGTSGAGLGGTPPRSDLSSAAILRTMWGESVPSQRPDQVRFFTGTIGALLWRLDGQNRTRALFHTQANVQPFMIGAERTDVEFEQVLNEDEWRNRQGLFVVRSFPEQSSRGGVASETVPEIQSFVPLSADGLAYDLGRIQRFPLVRYATMLGKRMTVSGATLEWWTYPISDTRRWFTLQPPPDSPEIRDVGVDLDLAGAGSPRSLSFAFRVEPAPGYAPPDDGAHVRISVTESDGHDLEILSHDARSRGSWLSVPADVINVSIPDEASRIHVTFTGVSNKEYVRVVEFKLVSRDVEPTFFQQVCSQTRDAKR